jgi:hypothetical protein
MPPALSPDFAADVRRRDTQLAPGRLGRSGLEVEECLRLGMFSQC